LDECDGTAATAATSWRSSSNSPMLAVEKTMIISSQVLPAVVLSESPIFSAHIFS
jgi:hypothetical protein